MWHCPGTNPLPVMRLPPFPPWPTMLMVGTRASLNAAVHQDSGGQVCNASPGRALLVAVSVGSARQGGNRLHACTAVQKTLVFSFFPKGRGQSSFSWEASCLCQEMASKIGCSGWALVTVIMAHTRFRAPTHPAFCSPSQREHITLCAPSTPIHCPGAAAAAKSVTPSRIIENINIYDFELQLEDMQIISDMNCGWRHLMWAETAMHPDYPFKDDLPYGYVPGPAPEKTTVSGR